MFNDTNWNFQFDDQEKKRYKALQQRQEQKHQSQLEELQRKNAVAVRELEHIQVWSAALHATVIAEVNRLLW